MRERKLVPRIIFSRHFLYTTCAQMTQWGKSMDFGSNVFLIKYLSNFDEEHPLIVNFSLNSECMNYVEDLLKEVDSHKERLFVIL